MSDRVEIFRKVRLVLQDAEKRGGPEGNEYVQLMVDVRNEANGRIDAFWEGAVKKRVKHI